MGKAFIQEETLTSIANAIRDKTGDTKRLLPSQMPGEIAMLKGGPPNGRVWTKVSDLGSANAFCLDGYVYIHDSIYLKRTNDFITWNNVSGLGANTGMIRDVSINKSSKTIYASTDVGCYKKKITSGYLGSMSPKKETYYSLFIPVTINSSEQSAFVGVNGEGVYVNQDSTFTWVKCNGITQEDDIRDVIGGYGLNYIALTTYGGLKYSTDGGLNFQPANITGIKNAHCGAFLNGRFVVHDATNDNIIHSSDGINWEFSNVQGLYTSTFFGPVNGLLYISFYDKSVGTYVFYKSSDGNTWINANLKDGATGKPFDYYTGIKDIAYDNGVYLGYGYGGIYWSSDGVHFNKSTIDDFSDAEFDDLAINTDCLFYVDGMNKWVFVTPTYADKPGIYVSDGI